jgi:uncharacterized protein YggE
MRLMKHCAALAAATIAGMLLAAPVPYRRMAAGMAASAPVAQGEETLAVTVSVSWAIKQTAP